MMYFSVSMNMMTTRITAMVPKATSVIPYMLVAEKKEKKMIIDAFKIINITV